MALKFFWRCEGTTLDAAHDYTAGDNTASFISLAEINTAAGMFGTNGLDCPTGSDRAEFTVSSGDLISSVVGAFGFSFRIATWENDVVIFRAHNSGAITNRIHVVTGTTNNVLGLRIQMASGIDHTISLADANIQNNVQYGLVCRYDEPNSKVRIELYNANRTLRASAQNLITNFDQPTGIDLLQIGVSQNGDAFDLHMDNVFIANAYDEPLENFLNILSYQQYNRPKGLTLFARMEGATLDGTHDYSVGDTTWTLTSDAVFNSSAALIYGTNGLDCPGFSDRGDLTVTGHDLIEPTVGSVGFIFRLPTIVDGIDFCTVYGVTNDLFRLGLGGGAEPRFGFRTPTLGFDDIYLFGMSIQANTIYMVVLRWDWFGRRRSFEMYNSSGVLLRQAQSSTTFPLPSNFTTVDFGDFGGAFGPPGAAQYKNLFLSKNYSEPLEKNLLITSYTQYNPYAQDGRRQGGRFRHVQAPDTFQAEMTSLKAWYGEDLAAASWFDEDIVVAEGGAPASRLQRSNRYQLANLGR